MQTRFVKMHGLGNDFVVLDGVNQSLSLGVEQLAVLTDRHRGIGCDQVLVAEPARVEGTDFHYRIFNADGSEVGQCGNGARCLGRFLREQGLTDRHEIPVSTKAGRLTLVVDRLDWVRVEMGEPIFAPGRIPFLAKDEAVTYELVVDDQTLRITALSMGNPHAVLLVEDVKQAPVERIGPLLERHERFPERVNVGFMAVRDRKRVDLRVWERGAGETQACGSGACAAVVAGQRQGLLDSEVRVRLPGGELMVTWDGNDTAVWLSGPAARVFEGSIDL